MQKIILLVSVILILLVSCKRDPIPRDAIPRKKYVDILVDVHLAEGIYKKRKVLRIDSIQSSELYLAVLDKYHVTEKQMLTTSLYYSRNQKEYDKIYSDVLSKISLLMEEQKDESREPEPVDEK